MEICSFLTENTEDVHHRKRCLVLYGQIQAVILTPYKTQKRAVSVSYDKILAHNYNLALNG